MATQNTSLIRKPVGKHQIEANSVVCSIEANALDESNVQHVHLVPIDDDSMVKGVDGRAWHCNTESIMAHAAQYPAQFAGDYFHASLKAEGTGSKAPASGWIDPTTLVLESNGIWADVQWTSDAAEAIRNKEYKFLSPVFAVNSETQTIMSLKGFGLTHYPNLGDLTPVANAQEPSLPPINPSSTTKKKENAMNEVIERLRYLLNLPALATGEDMANELDKVIANLRSNTQIQANQQDPTLIDIAAAIASHTAEQAQAIEANSQLDTTAFVPRTEFDRVQVDLNAILSERENSRVELEVNAALEKGVIAPASLAWAKDYCRKDAEGFAQFAANSAQIVPLGTAASPQRNAGSLDVDEIAMCSQLGLDQADYLKTKAKEMEVH